MRPYLAILKDSFREALASRILWVVIILTTVVLLLAAPAKMPATCITCRQRSA